MVAYADAEPLSLATRDLQQLEIFLKNLLLTGCCLGLLVRVFLTMLVLNHGCCDPCEVTILCRWHKALSTFECYVLQS